MTKKKGTIFLLVIMPGPYLFSEKKKIDYKNN